MQKGFAQLYILIALIILGSLGGIYFFVKQNNIPIKNEPRTCTQDAKQCPDGSFVSRTGPNCEFSPCPTTKPTQDETANWKTYADKDKLIQFNYPDDAKVTLGKVYSMLSRDDSDAITIEKPYVNVDDQGYIVDVVIKDNPQNIPTKTIIDNYLAEVEKSCSPPGCALPQKVRSTFKEYSNGVVDGYTFSIGGETDSVMVVQVKNNKTYIFRVSNGNGYATEQGIKVFNQILSTFKFLD